MPYCTYTDVHKQPKHSGIQEQIILTTPFIAKLYSQSMTVDTNPRLIRVAVFECLQLADNIAQSRGQFRDVFATWLHKASVSYNSRRPFSEHVRIETTAWNVVQGHYPPALDGIDAIIVSGSTASAYDQCPWVARLAEYIKSEKINQDNY